MKTLGYVLVAVLLAAALLTCGVWLAVHDEVARLQTLARVAKPVPPVMREAIFAMQGPSFLQRPRLVLRTDGPLSRRRKAIETYVVGRVVGSETLLRVYAHELYLGRIGGRDILGIEAASDVYFGKNAAQLTPAEAATLASMIPSPNVVSPVRYPERALSRRNRLLERMRQLRYLSDAEYERAVAEPLLTRGAAAKSL